MAKETASVFDRLRDADEKHEGIELNAFEVWLLMDQAGEAIAIGGGEYEAWKEFTREHDRIRDKEEAGTDKRDEALTHDPE